MSVDLDRRRELLVSSFSPLNSQFASSSPFATLVKRLQESLTRIETFEVVTVTPAGDGMTHLRDPFVISNLSPFC